MRTWALRFRGHSQAGVPPGRTGPIARAARVFPFVILAGVLAGIAQQNPMTPGGALRIDKLGEVTPVNQLPDANSRMTLQNQHARQANFAAANAERRKQIAADSANLLTLATELKTEIDKTDKNTLSLSVMRKAETIEKIARGLKEKMKLTVGAN